MQEPADVRVGFERIEKGIVAKARFDGTETDAVSGRFERGESGDEIGESVSSGTVEREVAAGEDDLAEAGGEEGARPCEHVVERNGDGRTAELRHDAIGALPGASILYF